jgi:group I intron endonuclease
MGCLYRIDFPSGKSYIGITAGTAQVRFAEHVYNATRGLGRGINRAIRKYGAQAATLRTVVIADDWEYLMDLERKAIKAFGTKGPLGYNMTDGGEGALGYKHGAEALAKMSATHAGCAHHTQPHSDHAKEKMRRAALGRKHSAETKQKIGAASRGNKYALGKTLTAEHRAAISAANKGMKWSEEARQRMSLVAQKREQAKRETRGSHGH